MNESVADAARRLCGEAVLAAEPCGGGGNNRVFRIRTEDSHFALKCYGSSEVDGRDRLGHEFEALRVLKKAGIGPTIPAAIAADRESGCALYEWIDGVRADDHNATDIAQVLDFVGSLHRARESAGARNLPPAVEATLRLADLLEQIETRLRRLRGVAPDEAGLRAFLADELEPELERQLAGVRNREAAVPLSAAGRTLSPSDFGFHNALRRPDGTLTFIDFEYFGWDDPVKLTADFLWHPAMRLAGPERLQFLAGAADLYGSDGDFSGRLSAYFPLFGIRWSLIMLNEFLPSLWERRVFAKKALASDWAGAKGRQLAKARTLLSAVHDCREGKLR